MPVNEKSRADYLREQLKRYGLRLVKSRRRKYTDKNDRGGYSVMKGDAVWLGPFHNATLEDVERLLLREASEFAAKRRGVYSVEVPAEEMHSDSGIVTVTTKAPGESSET
jgi:hypothetical protein